VAFAFDFPLVGSQAAARPQARLDGKRPPAALHTHRFYLLT